jgi:phenylalanyl-tRNA synthetase alpha chain
MSFIPQFAQEIEIPRPKWRLVAKSASNEPQLRLDMSAIESLERQAIDAIAHAKSTAELREIELRYLGKNGEVAGLMKLIPTLPNEEKPTFGKLVNEAKSRLESVLEARIGELKSGELQAQFEAERIDVTMPGRPRSCGLEHILQQTENKIKAVLGGMGFVYAESPELESFAYNFDALNYPADHPAMDEQDTFYIDDEMLLRTQCTALQGRIFERVKPPLRYFTIGRTFRNEAVDRTHSHTFHQVDCFMVDEGVSMAHLKGTLELFARHIIGGDVKIRFRPDFFPFVEPGVDYAISSPKLFDGRWIELGGAGLIHPNILERYGIDTERYSGFAFGLGVERIPMMAYGVDDLRHFLENDLRFLGQLS